MNVVTPINATIGPMVLSLRHQGADKNPDQCRLDISPVNFVHINIY